MMTVLMGMTVHCCAASSVLKKGGMLNVYV